MKSILTVFAFFLTTFLLSAQSITVEGYVYESNNRGYINQAQVEILEDGTNAFITSTLTDIDGFYKTDLPVGRNFIVRAGKDLFVRKEVKLNAQDTKPEDKKFVNLELDRKPGYIFDVTIAEPRESEDATTMGIHGATVEVYNNTTEKETMRLPDYKDPNFKVTFEQGNHYTLLIRKQGFYAKRMEAYVNVKGCILCFDGVGSVQPGVSDNLTAGHQMGTLLANVELKPIVLNETTKLDNIQYATSSAELNSSAKEELRKVVDILKNNPGMKVELSSHTDSRGKSDMNMKLSQKRAKVATEYIASFTGVTNDNIRARGYGETRLDNRCSDGVECNERQHQRNRRTEVQILEFNQEPKSAWKPLKELKRLDKMELLLEQLQNQEVVEIPAASTDDLPEDLKKQIAQEKKQRVGKVENKVNEKVGEIEEEAQFIETAPRNQSALSNIDTKIKAESAKTNPTTVVTQTTTKVESETAPAPSTVTEVVTETAPVTEVAESTYKDLKSLAAGYNGFKIQVHESAQRLPDSHELFQVFGNLTMDKTANGYTYLLGDFKESKDANLFLKKIIQPRFPAAKLIKFESGRRLIYQQ